MEELEKMEKKKIKWPHKKLFKGLQKEKMIYYIPVFLEF